MREPKLLQGAVLSFFEEGDEPRTTIATRRSPGRRARASGPRRPARGPNGERTVLARRAGAVGALIVIVVVVVFGLRAYLTSQQAQALKNYNSQVTTLLESEQQQVAQAFFTSLNGVAGLAGQALESTQAALYQDFVTARLDAQTAAGWSVPGSCADAQRDLLEVLDFRYEAINKVQASIIQAINGPNRDAAIEEIAGAMGMIYASDVIYRVRVAPLIEQALTNAGIQVAGTGAGGVSLGGTAVYDGAFMTDQSWTTAGYVAGKVLGYTPPAFGGTIGTGTHGHALQDVLVGTSALSQGVGVINKIPYTTGLTFTIEFTNDGQNDEFDVETQLTLYSQATGTMTTSTVTRETQPGGTYSATLGFRQAPPIGKVLKLTAQVLPVSGEKDLANNTKAYYVQFTK
jgi:hypothetical protein